MTTRNDHRFSLFATGAVAAIAFVSLPGVAHAFGDEPHCFATAPNWNAGKGAIVSGISPGPIAAVLNAVGESRTHTMISNETWATHSTTRVPSIVVAHIGNWPLSTIDLPNPSMPLQPTELAQGSPGFSQFNMGGAYAYWSTATQTWRQNTGGLTAPGCGNICQVKGAADWLWWNAPYDTVPTSNGNIYYSLNSPAGHLPYGFHQYMDGGDRVAGGESQDRTHEGIVCSQVPAYAYKHYVDTSQPVISGGPQVITPHTYSQGETANAGNSLWWSVYNDCRGQNGGFWTGIGNALIGLTTDINILDTTCNHAAWQVLNCFFLGEDPNGGGCKSIASSPWNAYQADGNRMGAQSVSPDEAMGLIAGRPKTGPWAWLTQSQLLWNGGGSTYGCYY